MEGDARKTLSPAWRRGGEPEGPGLLVSGMFQECFRWGWGAGLGGRSGWGQHVLGRVGAGTPGREGAGGQSCGFKEEGAGLGPAGAKSGPRGRPQRAGSPPRAQVERSF